MSEPPNKPIKYKLYHLVDEFHILAPKKKTDIFSVSLRNLSGKASSKSCFSIGSRMRRRGSTTSNQKITPVSDAIKTEEKNFISLTFDCAFKENFSHYFSSFRFVEKFLDPMT